MMRQVALLVLVALVASSSAAKRWAVDNIKGQVAPPEPVVEVSEQGYGYDYGTGFPQDHHVNPQYAYENNYGYGYNQEGGYDAGYNAGETGYTGESGYGSAFVLTSVPSKGCNNKPCYEGYGKGENGGYGYGKAANVESNPDLHDFDTGYYTEAGYQNGYNNFVQPQLPPAEPVVVPDYMNPNNYYTVPNHDYNKGESGYPNKGESGESGYNNYNKGESGYNNYNKGESGYNNYNKGESGESGYNNYNKGESGYNNYNKGESGYNSESGYSQNVNSGYYVNKGESGESGYNNYNNGESGYNYNGESGYGYQGETGYGYNKGESGYGYNKGESGFGYNKGCATNPCYEGYGKGENGGYGWEKAANVPVEEPVEANPDLHDFATGYYTEAGYQNGYNNFHGESGEIGDERPAPIPDYMNPANYHKVPNHDYSDSESGYTATESGYTNKGESGYTNKGESGYNNYNNHGESGEYGYGYNNQGYNNQESGDQYIYLNH